MSKSIELDNSLILELVKCIEYLKETKEREFNAMCVMFCDGVELDDSEIIKQAMSNNMVEHIYKSAVLAEIELDQLMIMARGKNVFEI